MIREILENNNIKIEIIRRHPLWQNSMAYYGVYNDDWYEGLTIEEVYIDYVKENGFKLEWFNERTKNILFGEIDTTEIVCFQLLDIINAYDSREENEEQIKKLIAWLYANDIKIIE